MSAQLFYLALFLAGLWLLYDSLYGEKRLRKFVNGFTKEVKIPLLE